MKKNNRVVAGLMAAALLIGGVGGCFLAGHIGTAAGNYTGEMKMDYRTDYADGGANTVERQGDHEDSPYFYHMDFYHAESGDGLYILPQFKTIQQTSWWSCGVSCTEMVLDYFGVRGDWNEESLAALRENHEEQHIGTCLDQVIDMLEAVGGFELETTYEYEDHLDAITMSFVRERIAAGIPILVGWNDWGGHWRSSLAMTPWERSMRETM